MVSNVSLICRMASPAAPGETGPTTPLRPCEHSRTSSECRQRLVVQHFLVPAPNVGTSLAGCPAKWRTSYLLDLIAGALLRYGFLLL